MNQHEMPYKDEFTPYYKCTKRDCWYCEMMGLKETTINPYLARPVRKLKIATEQVRIPYKNHQKKSRKIDY